MQAFDDRDTISVPIEHPSRAGLRRGQVVALRDRRVGIEYEFGERDRIVIGSDPGCDIVLDDPYVSGTHACVERRGDKYFIRDRRSKNGTLLNGDLVERAELRPGALLIFGKSELVAVGERSETARTAIEQLIGDAPPFRDALNMALRAARSDCSILLFGETGTGKELVARAIHEASSRASGPFVPLNCGGIPRELIASELFGHVRGAFTGAATDREGVFVQADGGTLFLDELGELPREQQPHLLRVLENRTVRRVGGSRERTVDVRVVAATNRLDLGRANSTLRDDLYHRVATVVIDLPPLRDRLEDIPLLVKSFAAELAPLYGHRAMSRTTLRALADYAWPGNVRELRHAVHRATALSDAELELEHLIPRSRRAEQAIPTHVHPESSRQLISHRAPALPIAALRTVSAHERRETDEQHPLGPMDAAMRDMMLDAYDRHGSIRGAAEALRIPKSTFADRARRLGIVTKR